MSLRIECLRGGAIVAQLDALATLRCAVFRDWPYLYEGTREYEARYLQVYIDSPRALAILVWDGERCVGASTAIPLLEAPMDVQQPFIDEGMDRSRIDYFGESVLLNEYRGRGLGVRFFELREAHARELGLPLCTFCAVERPADHPQRPAGHAGNDAFWTRRGYRPAPGLRAQMSWPDLGQTQSTNKPMNFWLRELEPAA